MDLRLKDKRALVTGSSRGLGYATALALAKEGCKVAINGRDAAKIQAVAEKLQKETGAQVIGLAVLKAEVYAEPGHSRTVSVSYRQTEVSPDSDSTDRRSTTSLQSPGSR